MDVRSKKWFSNNRFLMVFCSCLLLLSGGISLTAQALGVGAIKLHSGLNQPLDALIPLEGVSAADLKQLKVKLAGEDVYRKMGIDLTSELALLEFSVIETQPGSKQYAIQVSSNDSIKEPFLSFLIEVDWANGRSLKEFTVLLDPPVFLEDKPAAVDTPKSAVPPNIVINKPGTRRTPPQQQPRTVTTPSTVARNASRPASFVNELGKDLVYGPMTSEDTLWKVADNLRPDGVSIEQMMLALFRENPQAFFGNNVSMLKAGAILRIKDQNRLTAMSTAEALAEISRQHEEWLSYRRNKKTKTVVASASADITLSSDEGSESLEQFERIKEVQSQPLLELVTPSEETETDVAGTADTPQQNRVADVSMELDLVNEAAEAVRGENDVLKNRLAALEDQISAMQRLIQLKDRELQLMQDPDGLETQPIASMEVEMPISEEESIQATPAKSVEQPASSQTDVSFQDRLQSMLQDPISLVSLAILGTLIILLIILRFRKRSDEDELLTAAESDENDSILIEAELTEAGFNEHGISSKIEVGDIHDFNTIATSKDAVVNEQIALDGGDPLAEADVYLAYGRHKKAEELIKSAIKIDPDRHELKLKLLEVYYLLREPAAFENQAEQLYAALGGEDHPLWMQAKEWGADLCETNPLFTQDAKGLDHSQFEIPKGLSNPFDAVAADFATTQQDNVSLSDSVQAAKEDEIAASLDYQFYESKDNMDIDASPVGQDVFEKTTVMPSLTLDDLSNFETAQIDAKEEPKTSVLDELASNETALDALLNNQQRDEQTISFDPIKTTGQVSALTMPDVGDVLSHANDLESIVPATSIESVPTDAFDGSELPSSESPKIEPLYDEGDDLELGKDSFFLLNDEDGTKLDLARAYIGMGDQEAAQDLLNEVLKSGNNEQKKEAEALIAQTGGR